MNASATERNPGKLVSMTVNIWQVRLPPERRPRIALPTICEYSTREVVGRPYYDTPGAWGIKARCQDTVIEQCHRTTGLGSETLNTRSCVAPPGSLPI